MLLKYASFPSWQWLSPFQFKNTIWISGLKYYPAMIVVIPSSYCQDNSCKYNIYSLVQNQISYIMIQWFAKTEI